VFQATETFPLFDYLRVPYHSAGERPTKAKPVARLSAVDRTGSPFVGWPGRSAAASTHWSPASKYELLGIPFFAPVVRDDSALEWLGTNGRTWTRELPVTNAAGKRVASVWSASDGSVFLPFDPAAAFVSYLTERYLTVAKPRLSQALARGTRRAYYTARPALPRWAQIALRRRLRQRQERADFPRWPFEPAVDELSNLIVGLAARVAAEPVPMIALWPKPYSWALVLTHDVETAVGYEHLATVQELENRAGYRSSWNFVPMRDYRVEPEVVARLAADGFEVGVHGLRHDGRDFGSRRLFEQRLPAMHMYARQWNAVGFRSPSTHRRWEWMQQLDFDYDSSYTDTAPYEPQPGGCCTWLPYRLGKLVELPITMPQDHTLFEILRLDDETIWVEKALELRRRAGMALMLTHPDYMLEGELLPSYRRFLDQFASDETAWKPLPKEVAAWWRRREASRLERVDGDWTVVGPACEEGAVVCRGEPDLSSADRPAAAANTAEEDTRSFENR
jgi:hypothetical protein